MKHYIIRVYQPATADVPRHTLTLNEDQWADIVTAVVVEQREVLDGIDPTRPLSWEHVTSFDAPAPCSSCGWQYPDAILRAHGEGRISLDPNPTHACLSTWAAMTPEQEQAWHNGYWTPHEVRETEHGVMWRPQV